MNEEKKKNGSRYAGILSLERCVDPCDRVNPLGNHYERLRRNDDARITQGKITLRKEKLELMKVIGRAVETSRPFIESPIY
ncbi:MAG TPA: hypothetical protein VFV58_21970 [Blastocatellia bacterium]|jgi:hypothetical protein|nr:hypothetical protein [Blastocatellia bacterium]